MDDVDREFHRFLDEYPIYDEELLNFNIVTSRAYASHAAREYQKKLEIVLSDENHARIWRKRDEYREQLAEHPDPEKYCYMQEAQAARDQERGTATPLSFVDTALDPSLERVVECKTDAAEVVRVLPKRSLTAKQKTMLWGIMATMAFYGSAVAVALYNHYH